MVIFTAGGKDGEQLVFVGLEPENLAWLGQQGGDNYIPVDLAKHGVELQPNAKIVLFGGDSDVLSQLMEKGVIGPDTIVNVDPESIPDHAPVPVVDTIIVQVPEEVSELLSSSNIAEAGPALQSKLRALAMKQLMDQDLPDNVRKIELNQLTWTLTGDADEVEQMTPPHDCADCRDGLHRAAAVLREKPGMMAIGRIEYTIHYRATRP